MPFMDDGGQAYERPGLAPHVRSNQVARRVSFAKNAAERHAAEDRREHARLWGSSGCFWQCLFTICGPESQMAPIVQLIKSELRGAVSVTKREKPLASVRTLVIPMWKNH
jgi:hypothetical protein